MIEQFKAAMAAILTRMTTDTALTASDLAQLARAVSDLSYAKNDIEGKEVGDKE